MTIVDRSGPGVRITLLDNERAPSGEPLDLVKYRSTADDGTYTVDVDLRVAGKAKTFTGEGNGPLSAFVDALAMGGFPVRVLDYTEHALSSGGDALAVAYVECEVGDGDDTAVLWGVGRHTSITTASMKAVVSALNLVVRG